MTNEKQEIKSMCLLLSWSFDERLNARIDGFCGMPKGFRQILKHACAGITQQEFYAAFSTCISAIHDDVSLKPRTDVE